MHRGIQISHIEDQADVAVAPDAASGDTVLLHIEIVYIGRQGLHHDLLLAQQLVRRKGGGRVLAAELMVVTSAIRNLIREAKTPQIANALATSASVGSVTMDNSLLELYRSGVIGASTAVEAAIDQEYVRNNSSRW